MIITIDGPSCTGKSSTAFALAQALHLLYINSGLLFRGIAYIFDQRSSVAQQDSDEFFNTIDKDLKNLRYCYTIQQGAQLLFNDHNISDFLKTPHLTSLTSKLSTHPLIRDLVLSWQQRLASKTNAVIEGRDTGSAVFPDADIKIFLTASPEIRAQRWQEFQEQQGVLLTAQEAYHQVIERDQRDSSRNASPLRVPHNALIIDNSNLSIEQTLQTILKHIQEILPTA